MTKKKNKNKGANGKGEEQKEKVEKAENKSESSKEMEDNNNNEVHHDIQHNNKNANEDSHPEIVQEVEKKVKTSESERKDKICTAENCRKDTTNVNAEKQDCEVTHAKEKEQQQEKDAEEGARKGESMPGAVSNTECASNEVPSAPGARAEAGPSKVSGGLASSGDGSPSGLACSLCNAPCLGPCRKCREPLCPSCIPLHIFRARWVFTWKPMVVGGWFSSPQVPPLEGGEGEIGGY